MNSLLTGPVGLVGFGVMGAGLAQMFATEGREVVVVEASKPRADAGSRLLATNLRAHRLLARNRQFPPADELAARIRVGTDLGDLANAGFVVESATESWELKRELFLALDAICPPEAILASNTSAIPITKLASVGRFPSRVIGTHFMNPPYLKTTVEVVRGKETSDDTIVGTLELLTSIGRDGVVVSDSPGFVSNRVLMPMLNEAMHLVEEGVASAADIDRIFRECMGQAMGPLETADLIGLDTVLASLEVLCHEFDDRKFAPCDLLTQMVANGVLGRKTGRGFHEY